MSEPPELPMESQEIWCETPVFEPRRVSEPELASKRPRLSEPQAVSDDVYVADDSLNHLPAETICPTGNATSLPRDPPWVGDPVEIENGPIAYQEVVSGDPVGHMFSRAYAMEGNYLDTLSKNLREGWAKRMSDLISLKPFELFELKLGTPGLWGGVRGAGEGLSPSFGA